MKFPFFSPMTLFAFPRPATGHWGEWLSTHPLFWGDWVFLFVFPLKGGLILFLSCVECNENFCSSSLFAELVEDVLGDFPPRSRALSGTFFSGTSDSFGFVGTLLIYTRYRYKCLKCKILIQFFTCFPLRPKGCSLNGRFVLDFTRRFRPFSSKWCFELDYWFRFCVCLDK